MRGPKSIFSLIYQMVAMETAGRENVNYFVFLVLGFQRPGKMANKVMSELISEKRWQ